MGGPSVGGPRGTARLSCYRERSLPYGVVDGIEGTLGRDAQHDRLRVVQDWGNRHADRLNPGEVLSRLGKHQVEVLAGGIVCRARDESCCV